MQPRSSHHIICLLAAIFCAVTLPWLLPCTAFAANASAAGGKAGNMSVISGVLFALSFFLFLGYCFLVKKETVRFALLSATIWICAAPVQMHWKKREGCHGSATEDGTFLLKKPELRIENCYGKGAVRGKELARFMVRIFCRKRQLAGRNPDRRNVIPFSKGTAALGVGPYHRSGTHFPNDLEYGEKAKQPKHRNIQNNRLQNYRRYYYGFFRKVIRKESM